ncbi:DNA methylase [Vibrio phage 1.206.O._10N.222.51.B10]|nr:DNA methylase [Vibrio phage 1.206.O._10N.222.51.B10]
MIELINGDCLEEMKSIPDGSVDMILTDPPYGTTACKWDSIIPLEPMWEQLKRIVKPNGAICLFSNQPFTSVLIASNLKGFKYCWQWNKKIPSGMGYAKYRPMQQTEDICVFTRSGEKTTYNAQMVRREKPIKAGGNNVATSVYGGFNDIGKKDYKKTYNYKNPTTLIEFDKIRKGSLHPTQKPVALMEYLIKTYTNEGETVLDFTMGSGTTGVAAKNLNRGFIGIELDKGYFDIATERINAN